MIQSPSLSPSTQALWAKSDRSKDSWDWHPLICHLLDVAAACLEIIDREPRSYKQLLATDFEATPEDATRIVAALVGLHDIGKANPAFQSKNEACAARVAAAGFDLRCGKEIPHGIVSQAILTDLLQEQLGSNRRLAGLLADAVGAHHGFRSETGLTRSAASERRVTAPHWREAQTELLLAVWTTLRAPQPLTLSRLSPGAFQRLTGLTSVADWIGSSLSYAEFGESAETYLGDARGRVRDRLNQLGWTPRTSLSANSDFSHLFQFLNGGHSFVPRPLQVEVAKLTAGLTEPTLLLIEAPMGEGKTEAAFQAHVAIQNQLKHRGAYVGLPSQATGNAMFERLAAFLKAQGRQQPPDLQLLHGASLLNDAYQELVHRSNTQSDVDREESLTARTYFTHLKRALLSEYGAGTIDQALLSILPVKHHFVRLWGLGNRTVILDEVHAYDTYTGELLNHLVAWLRAMGSSVILMSATLPAATREGLITAFGAASELEQPTYYPRITRVHQGETTTVGFVSRQLPTLQVHSAPVPIAEIAELAKKLVMDGGCLSCIVNTVDRAQQLYEALEGFDGMRFLLHARFPIDQKQALESDILRHFGKGANPGPNPERPRKAILVGTQVIEQSLDLDFDVMITDLAPIDLILQRAGRLHRHGINSSLRGSHGSAVLYVASMGAADPLDEWTDTYWEFVYEPSILLGSWMCLSELSTINLNTDLDPLVQRVYNPDCRFAQQERFLAFLERSLDRKHSDEERDLRTARFATLGSPQTNAWERPPRDRLSEHRQNLLTRKSEPTVTVVPVFAIGGREFLDRDGRESVVRRRKLPVRSAKTIYQKTIRISRRGLVHQLKNLEQPWDQTPLLRDVYLLPLESGEKVVGNTVLRLDPELGLVYERSQ